MSKGTLPKDIFVIHSERSLIERQFFLMLHEFFADGPLSVWSYDDWSWEKWQRDSKKRVHVRKGLEIDPMAYMLKSQKPFVKRGSSLQVAKETLRGILRNTSVVIFVEPTAGQLSEGAKIETKILRNILDDHKNPHPRPVTIQIMLEPVRPVLTYVSPIDRTRWRTSFYLRLPYGRSATAEQLKDFAVITTFAAIITHFMNRIPHQTIPSVSHRILQRTIERACPIDVFGQGIQDDSYVEAAKNQSQTLSGSCIEEFREQWNKLMYFASKSRKYLRIMRVQLEHSNTKVVWPFLYHPETSSCAALFKNLYKPFDRVIERATLVMEEELARKRIFPAVPPCCELDLNQFKADSLERISRAIWALRTILPQKTHNWDDDVGNAVRPVFGWCNNDLPPQSLSEVLSLMAVIERPTDRVSHVVRAFLVFAYVVSVRKCSF